LIGAENTQGRKKKGGGGVAKGFREKGRVKERNGS